MIWRIGLKYPIALSLTAVCVGVDVITIYQGLFSDDWFYFTELGIKLWPTYRKYKEEVQMNDILLINNNWGISLPGDDSQPDTYTPTEQVSENVPQQVPASSDQQVVDNNQPTVNQESPPDNSSTPISGEDQGLSTVKNNSSGGSDLSLFSPEELVLKSNDLKVTIRQREVALQDPVFCSGSDASSNGKKMHLMELSVEIKNTSGQQGYLKGHLRVDRGNNGCACDCSEAKINIPKNNCQDNTESHCSTNWDTGRGCGIDFVFGKNTDDNTSTVNSTNSGMIVEHLCSDRNDSYVVKKSCWYFEKPEIDPGVTNTIKLSLIKD